MSVKPPGSRFPRWLCRARRCLPLLPGAGARGGGSCLARALRWRSRCAGSLFPRESSLAFLLHCEKCRSSVLLSRRNRGGSAATQGVSVGSGRCCSWFVPVSHRCSSECGSVNPWPLGHHLPHPGCAPFSVGNRSCSLGLSSVFGFCAAGGGFEALASLQQAREVIGAGRGPLLPLLLLQSRVTGRCQEFCKPLKEETFPGQGQRAWGPLEHPLLSPSCPSLPGPRSGTCNLELFLNACSSSRLAPCCSAGFKRCAWSGAHPSPWKTQISFFLI